MKVCVALLERIARRDLKREVAPEELVRCAHCLLHDVRRRRDPDERNRESSDDLEPHPGLAGARDHVEDPAAFVVRRVCGLLLVVPQRNRARRRHALFGPLPMVVRVQRDAPSSGHRLHPREESGRDHRVTPVIVNAYEADPPVPSFPTAGWAPHEPFREGLGCRVSEPLPESSEERTWGADRRGRVVDREESLGRLLVPRHPEPSLCLGQDHAGSGRYRRAEPFRIGANGCFCRKINVFAGSELREGDHSLTSQKAQCFHRFRTLGLFLLPKRAKLFLPT
jgi:hypothetical protein